MAAFLCRPEPRVGNCAGKLDTVIGKDKSSAIVETYWLNLAETSYNIFSTIKLPNTKDFLQSYSLSGMLLISELVLVFF